MALPVFIVISIVLAFAAILGFYWYFSQRAAVVSVLNLVSNLAQGQYARRADPTARGVAGELARAANALAGDLEIRGAKAQEDSDHLVSLLIMLDHTNEIALATDNVDTIRLANATAARVLERPIDALLGKHIETVVHHPDLRALYRAAFSATAPVSAQIALQTPGRTLHCQATAATIYSGSHYRGTFIVLRDITEVAKTLQMKTDFATNASHELRTPLASIRAAVETMKEAGTDDPETTRRCIDIINNHVLRLQLMVQDLLDLSRAEDSRGVVRKDRIDVQLVADALAGSYAALLAEKKISLKIELDESARALRGDERLLTLILKNLLDNAIKFTPAGVIVIRTYLQESAATAAAKPDGFVPAGKLAASGLPAGSELGELAADGPGADYFVLEVQDTGIGIPPEDQERVFERFYTVNRSRGGADRGTGLGLSIVKHAMSAMHGAVSLSSELQKGTVIRCIFPNRSADQA